MVNFVVILIVFVAFVYIVIWVQHRQGDNKKKNPKEVEARLRLMDANKMTYSKIKHLHKEEDEEESSGWGIWGIPLANIIAGFVILVVGVSLIRPLLETSLDYLNSSTTGNVSSFTESIVTATPMFFTFAIIAGVIGILLPILKTFGLIGSSGGL